MGSIILLNVLSYPFNLKVGLDTGRTQQIVVDEVKKVSDEIYLTKSKSVMSENDTKLRLLVIGYSPYLYDAFDTFPDTPFFATPVVHMKDYSKPYEELLRAIESSRKILLSQTLEPLCLKGILHIRI